MGGGYMGGPFQGGIFHGGRELFMKRAPDFLALFKKRWEIKFLKKQIFQLEIRSNIKLKTNRNYYAYEWIRPLVNTSLYKLF